MVERSQWRLRVLFMVGEAVREISVLWLVFGVLDKILQPTGITQIELTTVLVTAAMLFGMGCTCGVVGRES